MEDILHEVAAWARKGTEFAVATVIETWSSSPRQPGASMAVSRDGEVVGSVSGGCVEAAVYELAMQVLESGQPVTETYGVADEDAFAVGLTCGGTIRIFIAPFGSDSSSAIEVIANAVDERKAVAMATIIDGAATLGARALVLDDTMVGSLGQEGLDHSVTQVASGMLAHGQSAVVNLGASGEQRPDDVRIFVESFAPSPEMIIFGAIDFASSMVEVGRFLGFHVTLCDARPVFATRKRFPQAHEIVVEWPHRYLASRSVDERTVLCVLTHDPKFDIPLLEIALRSNAAYVGAMGSRRTHEDRMSRLREVGISEALLRRLSSPIGLDLGARTPAETALSIGAEIVALAWGGTGQRLSEMDLPIHR